MRGREESIEDIGAFGQRRAILLQRPQSVLIGGIALAQPGAEQQLQPRKAVEAEMLGEAHQGRGLHRRRHGDAGGGAEGDLVGMVERIGRHLRQPLGQFAFPFEYGGAQGVEILRGLHVRGGVWHEGSRTDLAFFAPINVNPGPQIKTY